MRTDVKGIVGLLEAVGYVPLTKNRHPHVYLELTDNDSFMLYTGVPNPIRYALNERNVEFALLEANMLFPTLLRPLVMQMSIECNADWLYSHNSYNSLLYNTHVVMWGGREADVSLRQDGKDYWVMYELDNDTMIHGKEHHGELLHGTDGICLVPKGMYSVS